MTFGLVTGAVMGIAEKDRYEFVTSSVRYHNEKIIQAFQLFIKLTTAVIGGTVYLSLQPMDPIKHSLLTQAALVAECAICLVCIITIWANVRAWWGFRVAESKLVGKDAKDKDFIVAMPTHIKSYLVEVVMTIVILLTFTLTYFFVL
jgi:hypothetical protein